MEAKKKEIKARIRDRLQEIIKREEEEALMPKVDLNTTLEESIENLERSPEQLGKVNTMNIQANDDDDDEPMPQAPDIIVDSPTSSNLQVASVKTDAKLL